MRKISTKLWFRASVALVFCTWGFAIMPVQGQDQVAVPGVVSQLTLDDQGRIKCELHSHDQISEAHHRSMRNNARMQLSKKKSTKKKASKEATIIVDYFNFDPAFSPEQFEAAKAAFQSAVDTWASSLESDEPIYVAAAFQPLEEGVLGSAGPTSIYANFEGGQRNTWYGNALADKLAGEDLDPTSYDIVANFSTVFPNWYFGIDGNTPATDYDFRTVVLHELCHGLGFFGSMFVDNASGIGDWGFGISEPVFPAIYDRYVYDRPGKLLIKKYPNFSAELGDVLLDDPLVFRGPNTVGVTRGRGAKIFTVLDSEEFGNIPGLTDQWLPGSSYSHVDFITYAGTENGLMVPFLSRGLAYDEPGKIVLAIFDDIGWNGKVRKPFVDTENARMAPIASNELESELNVFPNEIRRQFVLDVGVENENSELRHAQMVDMLGRVYQLTFNKRNSRYIDFELDAMVNKPGIYFLQLEFENQKAEVLRIAKVQ